MNILHEIDKCVEQFKRISGDYGRPQDTAIYLGRVQCAEFEAMASEFHLIKMTEPEHKRQAEIFNKHGHRYEYKGRKVYRVDAENHMAVGF